MTTTRFRAARMDCGAEEQLVRLRLDALEGIESVAVDIPGRTITVDHDRDPAMIETALDSLGLDTSRLDDDPTVVAGRTDPQRQRKALLIALAINATFFVIELVTGIVSRSLGLVADSLDMAADAGVYALSVAAVGRSLVSKKRLAATSGWLQLGLALAGLVEVVRRSAAGGATPDVTTMIVVSLLALAGNVVTLVILARVRSGEPHIQASWIFTANDLKVNLLVIGAAAGVAITDHPAPDLIVGALIFLVVANGARRILRLSR